MYLVLSTPDLNYAQAISHELWMISRPRTVSENETSQYYCGTFAHGNNTQVAIGPLDGTQNVHANADEIALVDLIDAAITAQDRTDIINAINAAKGGTIEMQNVIAATSLGANLRTREELDIDGWFPEIEGI
jgi:hypothetical protein